MRTLTPVSTLAARLAGLAALALVLLAWGGSPPAGAGPIRPAGAAPWIWMPLYAAAPADLWQVGSLNATPGSGQVWLRYYPKPAEQTDFKLVALATGHGEVLLSYPEAGDAVRVDADQPTALEIHCPVAWGGGTVPLPLAVNLRPDKGQILQLEHPTVFAGQPLP